ncbi:MAG TPA: winged helix-turn-helix domain-containing protein, partial [Ilumatobacteraceae bacterium]|nr:winged helix-turn-helix domain-containing protein [Ilumatobacteraceae bacterium]
MSDLPTWEDFNVPVLAVLSDGKTRTLRDLRRAVTEQVGLNEVQRSQVLPSGQSRADNRIGWAASYLNRVDALHRPSRGSYEITDLGRRMLAEHPTSITELDLRAVAKEGDEWWLNKATPAGSPAEVLDQAPTELDPTEQVERGVARIKGEVA